MRLSPMVIWSARLAWPAHPAWIGQFLTLLGTRIEHAASPNAQIAAE